VLLIFHFHNAEAQTASMANQGQSHLKVFADSISQGAQSNYAKAEKVVRWLAANFDWTATDYQKRTVEEIMARQGGNCNELAMVTIALLKELNLQLRNVREINIHKESAARRENARQKILEKGNRMSVFGKRHNDHVWIELYDDKQNTWIPADPSLGVIGEQQWIESRAGFGKRFTLDATSEDMIVPIAIFATDENGKLIENRTQHYVVDGLNHLYDNKLVNFKNWDKWRKSLAALEEKCWAAFLGEVNLHDYESQIDSLAVVYNDLKTEYQASQQGKSH
jgi:hypothetical protein